MFSCVDNSCIPQFNVCNGIKDCPCFEDELLCENTNTESLKLFPHINFNNVLDLSQDYYFVFLPDDHYDFLHCDNSDYHHYIPDNKWCVYEYINSNSKPIDCPFAEPWTNITEEKWRDYFKCPNREPKYCPFAEHLRNCSEEKCKNYFKCPNSYCIPYKYVCDDIWDCPRGYDEQICNNINCSGSFRCQNQTVCISLTKVCDGIPNCFLSDDEIFCEIHCPPQCLCISTGVTCSNTGISKIPSFGEKYELNILFLNVEGNPLQLDAMSFVHLNKLQYLNISNSNIKNVCLQDISIFLFIQKLLILDVSKNKIFTLSTMCMFGLPNLKILYIQQNLLSSIYPIAFFNLYSLPLLKLNNIYLEYLGDSFFCSKFQNNLETLDISRNKLRSVSSKTFECLDNLKVLFIYENRFHIFVSEDVIKKLALSIYLVEYSVECCRTPVALCMFFNQYTISCQIKSIPANALISMQLLVAFIGFILNGALLVMYLYTGLYQKKPLQFLLNVKDVIATVSYTSLSIFALNFSSHSAIIRPFCLTIGVITSVTFLFDVCIKVGDSLFLLKLLQKKSIQSRHQYRKVFKCFILILILCLIGTFSLAKVLSIEELVSLSMKSRETLLHCILFCFPKYHTILFPFCLILILLTFWNALNLKFILSLNAQVSNMKDLGCREFET